MVAALGAPGRQLQSGVRADPDDRERAVLALVTEAHDLGVEAHAGLAIVDRQDEMVERHHGAPSLCALVWPGRVRWLAVEAGVCFAPRPQPGAVVGPRATGRPGQVVFATPMPIV